MNFDIFYSFFDIDSIKEVETSENGLLVLYEIILKPKRKCMTDNYRWIFAYRHTDGRNRNVRRIHVTHSLRDILTFIGIYGISNMSIFTKEVFIKYGKNLHNRRIKTV